MVQYYLWSYMNECCEHTVCLNTSSTTLGQGRVLGLGQYAGVNIGKNKTRLDSGGQMEREQTMPCLEFTKTSTSVQPTNFMASTLNPNESAATFNTFTSLAASSRVHHK